MRPEVIARAAALVLAVVAGTAAAAAGPQGGPPYPIILVHGFSGFSRLGPFAYFSGVQADLRAQGEDRVFTPSLPPYHSVEHRGALLAAYIDEVRAHTGARRVHIIAHSQGGLDARHAISTLGRADSVATLTTIASPHRGTPLADLLLRLPAGLLEASGGGLSALIAALDDPAARPATAGRQEPWADDLGAAAASLSTAGAARFNEATPDHPAVAYFSVAAVSDLERAPSLCRRGRWGPLRRADPIDPLLGLHSVLISGGDPFDPTPNDGIVPTASMLWGTFLGCVPADHLDEVGWLPDALPHPVSGFDHLQLFRELVAMLRSWEQQSVGAAEGSWR